MSREIDPTSGHGRVLAVVRTGTKTAEEVEQALPSLSRREIVSAVSNLRGRNYVVRLAPKAGETGWRWKAVA